MNGCFHTTSVERNACLLAAISKRPTGSCFPEEERIGSRALGKVEGTFASGGEIEAYDDRPRFSVKTVVFARLRPGNILDH